MLCYALMRFSLMFVLCCVVVQVVSYVDILTGRVTAGRRVAVVGAGGIGFDVSDFLTHNYSAHNSAPNFESVQNDNVSVLSPQVDKV